MVGCGLFNREYAGCLALGVGALGGRVAAAGQMDGFGDELPWAACDTVPARLLATGLERKLLLAPRQDWRQFWSADEEVGIFLAGRKLAVLFGALDEPEVPALMRGLEKALRQRGLSTAGLGLSATVEGELRDAILSTLESWLGRLDVPPSATPAEQEALLLDGVKALLGALAVGHTEAAFGLRRLTDLFSLCRRVRAVVGRGEGPEAPWRAVAQAREEIKSWEDADPSAPLAVALTAGRELGAAEAATLALQLRLDRRPEAETYFGLGAHSSLRREALCLLLRGEGQRRPPLRLPLPPEKRSLVLEELRPKR